MSQQYLPEQRPYSIERASTKGPMHLRHTRRISQLQSKANFFEGQINPIYNENISLKEQLMQLSKMVSSSTDILRNLLPNQEDPNKKLKLQLANLQEIASIIRVDWKDMEKTLGKNNQTIRLLQSEKMQWRKKYQMEYQNRLEQIDKLKNQNQLISAQYQERIILLQKQIASIITQNNQQKQRMKGQFTDKLICYDLKFREFQIFKREITGKYEQYQKCIGRLRGEIEANLITFEENKKHLKGIYDKITADKLAELAEGYEMMLKIRQQERQNLVRQMLENQEESKRTVAMKQMEIATLNQQNCRFKEEVGSLRDDIWKKQIQIDQQFAENQQILREVQKLGQKNTFLTKKIEEQQKQFTTSKGKLEETIRKKQKQILFIKEEGSNALQKIRDEKQVAEDNLIQKQKRLKQVLLSIKKSQDEWQAKTNLLKQEWVQQKMKMQVLVAENAKKLQQQSQKLRISLFQKQQLKKQSQKNIRELERQYTKEKEYQNKLWNSKLIDLEEKNKDQMIQLQCQHERALSDANMNANEEMRLMTIHNNKKLADQQSKFTAEIQTIKAEGEQMQKNLRKAEVKLKAHDEQVQKIKVQHTKTMRQIEQQRRQQKQKMDQQMQKQMKDFQVSMQMKEAQFQKSLEQKQAELHSIKQEMENEIKMLKQANAIEFIENRYLAQICKLKEQFQERSKQKESQKIRQRQLLEQSKRKQVQLLSNNYQREIAQLKSNNQYKFSQLQASFHKNMTFIADNLQFTTLSASAIEQMSNQQKRECIVNKIKQMKKDLKNKDITIAQMACSLQLINQEIQKKVQLRKEQLEKEKQLLQNNCIKKIDDVNSECQAKINRAEKEKMQHTQILYQQFETMRQKFQGDYGNLYKKYNELQILFEERPSRAQDLTKIKQLTNMQNRMDIQIQTYHKKMETANQIVKYLNLQLSNYKDAYDIFGPCQDGTGGIVGHSVAKSPQKSKESQYVVEALKTKKHDSQLRSGDQILLRKQSIQIKRWNDSPTINELNVFEQNECNQSMTLEPNQVTESKQIRTSNLLSQKSMKKQRYKTQKVQKVDNEAEIIINAQHFIRLIKANKKEQLTGIQEVESEAPNKRRSYRKRVIKRYPTMGIDHYF